MAVFLIVLGVLPASTAVIATVYLAQYRPKARLSIAVVAHFLAVTLIICGYAVLCLWYYRPTPLQYPGWAVFALGSALFWYSVRCHPTCLVPDDQVGVVRAGPYHRIRHPIYAGGLVGAFGLIGVAPSWPVLVVWLELAACLMLLIRVEERELAGRLGSAYREYSRQTRLLVPGVL